MSESKMNNSLGRQAVKGGVWIFSLKVFHRIFGLIRTILLARLLAPSDFGLMGVAVLAIGTLETFSKPGVETALVQKKGNVDIYLDTAWTVLVIRSLLLFTVLYLGAPFVAVFFKSPQATQIIRVLAFVEFFKAFKNVGTVYFQRELRFDKRFILEFSGLAVNMLVSISVAIIYKNVWALVYGSLSGALTTCLLSYAMHPYRPKVSFNAEAAKDLIGFGKWIFFSSILFFLVTQGDSVFIGKVLGISALGFYQMASRLSHIVATESRSMVFHVLFPVYSKIQDDLERLKKAYVEVLNINNFLMFPLSAGIVLLAADFTRLFLGNKWMPMVPAMRVLAITGLLFSIASTANVMFYARGKPRVETIWHGIRLIVLAVFIFPLSIRWNILGTSLAVLVSTLVWAVGFIISIAGDIRLRAGEILRTLLFPIMNTILLVAVIVLLKWKMGIINALDFFILIVVGSMAYFIANYICARTTDYEIFAVIKKRIGQVAE